MSEREQRLAALVQQCRGSDLDGHYVAFFQCFNRQEFFEAHEVLEALWLERRGSSKDHFYKGLIQLAGAFVHVQKGRPQPAAALFNLARCNLEHYRPVCDRLEIDPVLNQIGKWLRLLGNQRSGELCPQGRVLVLQLLSC